jgi:hypothetical protein
MTLGDPSPTRKRRGPHRLQAGWSTGESRLAASSRQSPLTIATAVQPSGGSDVLETPIREDFRVFRRIGVTAAVASAAVRLVIFFGLAATRHNPVVLRYLLDMIPYPVVLVGRAKFASLVSQSTLGSTIAMLLVFAVAAIRHARRNQQLLGWFMGVFGCAQMLLVDVIRHHLTPPVVVRSTALWTLWPLCIAGVILAICRRDGAQVVKDPTRADQKSERDAELP